MADTATARITFGLSVDEVIDFTDPLQGDPTVVQGTDNSQLTRNGSSSPGPITKTWIKTLTLLAGVAQNVDLTALSRSPRTDLTLNGLKVQTCKIVSDSANTAPTTVEAGASNGYDFLGVASSACSIPINGKIMFDFPEGNEDVDSTHKIITFTCAANATIRIHLCAG